MIAACGGGQIQNLPLMWRAADSSPRPSDSVARAFSAAPFAFGLRDVRPDLTAVGSYGDSGFVVRTSDNVAQYCSGKMGEMLAHAGAQAMTTAFTLSSIPASCNAPVLQARVLKQREPG